MQLEKGVFPTLMPPILFLDYQHLALHIPLTFYESVCATCLSSLEQHGESMLRYLNKL